MRYDLLDMLWPFGVKYLPGGVRWLARFFLLVLSKIMQLHCPKAEGPISVRVLKPLTGPIQTRGTL